MGMTPEQYRAFLDAKGLTQEGFAVLLGASGRTGQRWANVAVPPPVDMVVRLLLERPELLDVVQRLAYERDQGGKSDVRR